MDLADMGSNYDIYQIAVNGYKSKGGANRSLADKRKSKKLRCSFL
jgi:hypothetical protein